ncbi:bifunctional 2',3'-cyclic-nucleotide 2'-phosphodiesterase/3'-nucleotidase [Aliidiomarina shirensis]|nr:bifunctional 2',3'-cyclic-nucleotide 2'-phosphodiesterase/3'-nucleotidase [Aliidiomarina shirensis]
MKMLKITLSAVLISGVLLGGCSKPTAPAEVNLRLIETTDLHAYMLGYDYFQQQSTDAYGLVHTAALIHEARAENPNNFLIDNGDLIQGSAFGDWVARNGVEYVSENAHPIIRALNHLQYDVGNMGNHEFNYGLEFLHESVRGAEFPYISANVFHASSAAESGKVNSGWDNPMFEPYVILAKQMQDQHGNEHEIKVGFIGFLPPQIVRWDQQHLAGKVRVRDMVEAAEYYIPKMRAEGADVVVAVPHSGLRIYDNYPQFAEQASYQLAGVEGIDAILFGHQHQLFPGSDGYNDLPEVDNEAGYVRGVPAVAPGYWGDHLGIIDLRLQHSEAGWKVLASEVAVRAVDERKDTALEAMLMAEHEETIAMLNEPLGEVEARISTLFARIEPSTAVQLINDAQTWLVESLQARGEVADGLPVLSAAAPFRNGFQSADDYTIIEAGEFTLGNLVDLYVYPNTLQVVEVTGAQLVEWLEMSALAYQQIDPELNEPQALFTGNPSFNFDVLSGIEYRFDITQPARYNTHGELINADARRVVDVSFAGAPLDMDQRFLVAVNNYRAGGGGGFPGLDGSTIVHSSGEEVRQVIANYAREMTMANDGILPLTLNKNWAIDLPEGVIVEFRGNNSEAGKEEAENIESVKKYDEDLKGYAIFHLKAYE